MEHNKRIVILGGHGKVARLTANKLRQDGFDVDGVIRDSAQSSDVENAGGQPVVLDMEDAEVSDLAQLFSGAMAIVFAAGAGGGSPVRTRAVDHDAAIRTMQAAEQAGVRRYVMVSYARASVHYKQLDPDNSFYPYAKAKHDADMFLRESTLDYTILGPGRLTQEAATGQIQLADQQGQVDGNWPEDNKVTSRDNVAAVITHVIESATAVHQTVNFYDGATPITRALAT